MKMPTDRRTAKDNAGHFLRDKAGEVKQDKALADTQARGGRSKRKRSQPNTRDE